MDEMAHGHAARPECRLSSLVFCVNADGDIATDLLPFSIISASRLRASATKAVPTAELDTAFLLLRGVSARHFIDYASSCALRGTRH